MAITSSTLTRRPAVEAAIAAVREAGFAYVDQEAEPGFRSIAVPVRRFDGHVIAALNVGARVDSLHRFCLAPSVTAGDGAGVVVT